MRTILHFRDLGLGGTLGVVTPWTSWNEKQQTEGGPAGILFQLLMAFVYFKGPPPPHPNKNHLGKNRCRSCCFSKMLGPTSPNPITFRTSVCSQWYMTTETPKNKHMAPLFFFASLFQASCGYRSGTAPAWSAWLLGIFCAWEAEGLRQVIHPNKNTPTTSSSLPFFICSSVLTL